jgi:hypothetical protein
MDPCVDEVSISSAIGPLMETVEGVIIAFDAKLGKNAIELSLNPWVELIEKLGGENLEFKLIASVNIEDSEASEFYHNNESSSESASASNDSRATALDLSTLIEFGLDHFYEVVTISSFKKDDIKEGHLEREKVGVPRVVEAAESSQWSSMVMKAREARPPISTNHQDQLEVSGNKRNSAVDKEELPPPPVCSSNTMSENGENEATDALTAADTASELNPSLLFSIGEEVVICGLSGAPQYNGSLGEVLRFNEEEKRFVVKIKSTEKNNKNNKENKGKTLSVKAINLKSNMDSQSSSNDNNKDSEGEEEDMLGGVDLEKLESILDEARLAREAASKGSMSDDERRSVAAATALKMLSVFGSCSDDSGSDSDN